MTDWILVSILGDIGVFILLVLAASSDFDKREIPDWISVLVATFGVLLIAIKLIIGVPVIEHVWGLVIALPLIILGLAGKLGGGDYKLLLALGLYMGIYYGLTAVVLITPVIICLAVYYLIRHKSLNIKLPLAPLILAGFVLVSALKWLFQNGFEIRI